jgi:acetolactate decarboxylase
MNVLYNANTRSAYQAGYYTGSFAVADILGHGDTGLGALDGNDGELIISRGTAWRTAADGTTHQLDSAATSPFATVIPFHVEQSCRLDDPLGREEFESRLSDLVPLVNRIWALRIHGTFVSVTAGASDRQQRPYRPLDDVMHDYQRHTWTQASGTLVGFYCPVFLTGIDYVGGHYHWLSDDHQHGGHIFDFITQHVTVEACEAVTYMTQLPATSEFRSLELVPYYQGSAA